MASREQKVKELLQDFQSLRRQGIFHSPESSKLPRITPSQWSVLFLIGERGGGTVKDLASTLGITSSATTQLVNGLVRSRYVVRNVQETDHRIVLLTLSKKTKTQVEKMKTQVLKRFLELFDMLDDKEFEQYLFLNKKIVERFSKK